MRHQTKRFVGPKSGRVFSAIFAQTLSSFSGALFTGVNNFVILLLLCCFPGVSVTVIPDAYGPARHILLPTPVLQQLMNPAFTILR
ncbi:hypothetical protein ARMGADRAFT_1017749 [Armillaria gallica]|uniref:Uncharacterized protein n=1 Tax=Armillaria gallica TaxID=47427 RepID=A0A2H3CV16_ARMGA|nr:hypothetical protein ARMGADRAFT_1017749 [Armillaria gallica]